MQFQFRKLVAAGVSCGCIGLLTLQLGPVCFQRHKAKQAKLTGVVPVNPELKRLFNAPLPSRQSLLDDVKAGEFGRTDDRVVDVLIIGGGATGTGVALDAVTRGLTTLCVEKFDFASGTSSRSTKLIHGGVRYLQKAIMNLDMEQYNMVREALQERSNLLSIAPHLTSTLPIIIPAYKLWQLPYYWVGMKLYDLISMSHILKPSYIMTRDGVIKEFPLIKSKSLKGAIIYHDGQHDDARMCLSIALTAIRYGAKVLNYMECVELIKGPPHDYQGDPSKAPQVVNGAKIRDRLTGTVYTVKARCIINATGPYTDFIRTMDDQKVRQICQPSSGVHIMLPSCYSPERMGLLDPSSKDGRVIFLLPWMGGSLAGTTDTSCEVTDTPRPTEEEVQFILEEVNSYMSPEVKVSTDDVLSTWSGIRPLVLNPNSTDNTESLARNHIIEVSPSRLITIAGGKWTTYRSMAQETMDMAIEVASLNPAMPESQTLNLLLEGAHQWHKGLAPIMARDYDFDDDVASHLTETYGDKARKVVRLYDEHKRLHESHPIIEAEVKWACREYAMRAVDFVSRRSRLSFVDVQAAKQVLPRVVQIMGDELGWNAKRRQEEHQHALAYIENEMGLGLCALREQSLNLDNDFKCMDKFKKGAVTVKEIETFYKSRLSQEHFSLLQARLNQRLATTLNRDQFIETMKNLASKNAEPVSAGGNQPRNTPHVTVDRSGGGV